MRTGPACIDGSGPSTAVGGWPVCGIAIDEINLPNPREFDEEVLDYMIPRRPKQFHRGLDTADHPE